MQNVLVLDDNPGTITEGFSRAGYKVKFFDNVDKFDNYLLTTEEKFQYIFLDFYINKGRLPELSKVAECIKDLQPQAKVYSLSKADCFIFEHPEYVANLDGRINKSRLLRKKNYSKFNEVVVYV